MHEPFPDWLVPAWREFLAAPSMDRMFNTNMHPLQRRREMERMIALANRRVLPKPTRLVEIGADKAADIWVWLTLCPSLTHVVVNEIRGTPYREVLQAHFHKVRFLWVDGTSEGRAEEVRRWLPDGKADVIFIDGDKSGFVRDFLEYGPLVRNGGAVLMHDVLFPYGAEALNTIARMGFKTERIIDEEEIAWAVDRSKRGIAAETSYEDWLRVWSVGPSCGVGVIWQS